MHENRDPSATHQDDKREISVVAQFVIPAKAGIPFNPLDPRFRRDDNPNCTTTEIFLLFLSCYFTTSSL
ncbi:MAG: hypothetical protein Q8P84_05380 [Deltaproteobacteria bacterium]|nr:hypothetical protein [Deltaproteobacteria bacterium]